MKIRHVPWKVEIPDHRVVKELDSLAVDVRQRASCISELIEKHGGAAVHGLRQQLEGRLWKDANEG
jgi:hypothetical protein